jgi:hypothetical protein
MATTPAVTSWGGGGAMRSPVDEQLERMTRIIAEISETVVALAAVVDSLHSPDSTTPAAESSID